MSIDQKSYELGRKSAWLHILQQCYLALGERAEGAGVDTRYDLQALRELCAEFGDNDWPGDLALVDIIDKHLVQHLVRSRLRVDHALEVAGDYGQYDGEHRKQWVIDQMVQYLIGDKEAYNEWCRLNEWQDRGIAP